MGIRVSGRGVHLYLEGNTYMHYGMAALRVFCKLSGTIIIFRDVIGEKTGKASQGHILQGPENYLDEFSLISVGTGEPLEF